MAEDPDKDETLHEKALRHADEAYLAEIDNFDEGRDDQRFAEGDQWLAEARAEREGDNRPVITVNRIKSFVRQVTGDVRRDTPSIKVAPAKGPASQAIADIYNGLIRNIEQQSNAKAAYVNATEGACIPGMGNIKVVTEYSANDGFEQDIRIKRIPDHFAVLWDPHAKEPDKSDARFLLELVGMPKEEFNRQYPKHTISDFPLPTRESGRFAWFTDNVVWVAQYWYREPVKKMLLLLEDGRTITAEQALKETETGQTIAVKQKREVEDFEVKQCIVSGNDVLSGPHDWAGRHIPYAPVVGEETFLDGRIMRQGMVRAMKDAQRVYNYMRTAAVEAAALQPKMPWLVSLDHVKGLESIWDKAGSKNLPWLPYNVIPNSLLKPERAAPALAQSGLDQQSLFAADELKAIPGMYDASLGAKSNETSGRAILARQREGETGTIHFVDNLATGIRRIGIILVDLIPKIYDTERVVRVLREDGSHEMAVVNQELRDPLTQAVQKMNDLGVGEYDVVVETGKSYATRRQESAEMMQGLIQAAPALLERAGDLLIKNMDFPGAEEVAKRLAPPEPGSQQPDPTMIAQVEKDMASAQKTGAEAQGVHIDNAQKAMQLEMMMSQIGQVAALLPEIQQFMQALSQAGPPQGQGGPQGPPPGSMPPGAEGMPPGGPQPQMMQPEGPPPGPPELMELTPLEMGGPPQ